MFQVVGGESFEFQVEGNPTCQHNGSLSLWHIILDGGQPEQIVAQVEERGATVTAYAHTETADQTALHQRYLESTGAVFPCIQCAHCSWLDVQSKGYCGHASWEEPRRQAFLEAFPQAIDDVGSCPLGGLPSPPKM